MRLIALLLLLVFAAPVFSQEFNAEENFKDTASIMSLLTNLSGTVKGGMETELEPVIKKAFQRSKDFQFRRGCASAIYVNAILHFRSGKFAEARKYFLESIAYRDSVKETFFIAKAKRNAALCEKELGNYNEAMRLLESANSFALKANDSVFIAQNYETIGQIYENRGLLPEAQTYYLKSLRIHKIKNNQEGISNSLNNIGNSFFNAGDFEKSIKYYQESYLLSKKAGHISGEAKSLANWAMALGQLKRFDESLAKYEEARLLFVELNNPYNLGVICNNMASVYSDRGDYRKGAEYQKMSINYKEKTGDKTGLATSYVNLGNDYFHLGKFPESESYFKKGIKMCSELGMEAIEMKGLRMYAELLRQTGKFREATNALVRYDSLRQKIENAEIRVAVADLEKKYNEEVHLKEIAEKDRKIEIQNNILLTKQLEAESKQRLLLYVAFALVTSILIAVFLFRSKRKADLHSQLLSEKNIEISERNKEIEVLLGEIHHRVKNNLQVVSSLLSLQQRNFTKDSGAGIALQESRNRIQSMGIIHKLLYQESRFSEVNMKEFTNLLCLELGKLFDPARKVKITLPGHDLFLDVDRAVPLGLILNELVMNAYKHAFENVTNPELKINFGFEADKIVVLVSDNGKGTQPDLFSVDTDSFGIKLIRALCRQLNAALDLQAGNGTSVKIEIPNTKN